MTPALQLVKDTVSTSETGDAEPNRLGIWRSPATVIAIGISVTSIGFAPALNHVVPEITRTAIVQARLAQLKDETSPRATRSPADLLRAIRAESGFTWEQIARVFGVSRRAVHHWAAGERMSTQHIDLLSQLALLVSEAPGADGAAKRSALLLPGEGGLSAVEAFRLRATSTGTIVNPAVATQAALLGAD